LLDAVLELLTSNCREALALKSELLKQARVALVRIYIEQSLTSCRMQTFALPFALAVGRLHNETVHQNGMPARIRPRAVSGATGLLETISFLFLYFTFYAFAARPFAGII